MFYSPKDLMRHVWEKIISYLESRQSRILFSEHYNLLSISEKEIQIVCSQSYLLKPGKERSEEILDALRKAGYTATKISYAFIPLQKLNKTTRF